VIGPSAAGKSTLACAFAADHPEFELVRTHTTRPPRPGEAGTHVFVSDEVFDATRHLGTLTVFGARYGLPPFGGDRAPLILLRFAALDRFAALFPDARVIQVEAPVNTLISRLHDRGDPDRAVRPDLIRETRQGREAAQRIIRTDQPFARALEQFTAAVLDE
jgi:guanylate kinase